MHIAVSDQPSEHRATKQSVEVGSGIRRERPQPACYALNDALIFRQCRKIEDRAEILQREPALIVRAVSNVETLDNERGRHAVRHRSEHDIGRRKAGGAPQFQTEPFDIGSISKPAVPAGFKI
ncbi:hypothetical protein K663_12410 [Sphingobium sp. MI1205]|nr:hypothetical protein K663_12410 [Sphingobium sp. MI1205]